MFALSADEAPSKEINNPDGQYGEKFEYDPDFKGPLHQHSCTDVVFLILFIVYIVAWIATGCVAFANGDPNKLLHPEDSSGKRCGLDESVKNKPYLMYFDLTKCVLNSSILSTSDCPKVCVSECPKKYFTFNGLKSYNDTINDLYCTPGTKENLLSMESIKNAVNNGKCAAWYVPSQLVGKRCLPESNLNSTLLMRNGIVKQDPADSQASIVDAAEKILAKLERNWPWIVAFMFITEVVCIIYLILIYYFTAFMVWFSLFFTVGLFAYGLYYSSMKIAGSSMVFWMFLLILYSFLLLLVLCMVVYLRKKIDLAIALIREASRALAVLKSTLAFPILSWVLQFIVVAWTIAVSFYLCSCGERTYNCYSNESKPVDICDPSKSPKNCGNCTEGPFEFEGYVKYLQIVNLFGFYWGMSFVSGFSEMVLAGAFATWYWTFKKDNVPFFTFLLSIHRTVRYHLGTVAFGSLLIAICKLIRIILESMREKLKNSGLIVLLCLQCIAWCLEGFIKFINRNAYIICAVHGKNFCHSARTAFNLIMRNILRALVLNKVTDFLLFLGILAVTIGMTALSFFVFIDRKQNLEEYDVVPVAIVFILSYFIASSCFEVFAMAVDTLFLCFLEDLERNDGSPQKPYFMSKKLLLILVKKD